jgi:hypothetical protein
MPIANYARLRHDFTVRGHSLLQGLLQLAILVLQFCYISGDLLLGIYETLPKFADSRTEDVLSYQY